ncbi:3,4-dihydroxyphenylacetate 2,3-dioxygenase [soil metagenome]
MLDKQWVTPSFDVVRAAHAEYVVTDLDRSAAFYADLLGFVVTERTADAVYLRGYEEQVHHSLVLRAGPQPLVGHLAFRVATPGCLDRLAEELDAQGCRLRWVEDEEAGQGRALRVQDPLGYPIEFFFSMQRAERMLQRFDLYKGARVMRLDHFNLHVPDVKSAYDHYKRLGFRCSEYTVTDPPEENLWAAWMYRKPGVHDVALMNGDGPRLHHLGFWVQDTHSVLQTCDILAAAGRADAIELGPGRHGLSNAFFLYLRDPDGHRIELYTGDYYTGDPDFEPIRWSVDDPRRGTFWGHAAPLAWFVESSLVAGFDGGTVETTPQQLHERPQTAT